MVQIYIFLKFFLRSVCLFKNFSVIIITSFLLQYVKVKDLEFSHFLTKIYFVQFPAESCLLFH